MNDLFSGANGELVFGQGQQDPSLKTGHYDDGHAFGWGVKSQADELKVFSDLNAFSNNQLSQLIAAPGQTIDTTIGPPTIH